MKNLDVYMKQLPVDYDMLFLGNCEEIATTTTPDVLVYKKILHHALMVCICSGSLKTPNFISKLNIGFIFKSSSIL